jgi:hypothetical protein
VVTCFVWWLTKARIRLNSTFSSHCRYSTPCFEKAVDVMKTKWLMTNSLCPRQVHILSARPKRLESSRRTCLGSRETKVSNCTVHYALPVWILGGESIGRRYNEM